MYKSKKEVDAHVRTALSKLRNESERNLRGFTIAKLYYKIGEYACAEQYLCSHLSVKEDNDQAHKTLGQCYQRLKKPDKALQSFQRSLQLNPKQPDVLVEVCQLLLEDKNLNENKAKYWCDLAESEKVQHDAVFSLRLRLMKKDNLKTNQVEEIIQKEISARPNEVQLRVRLVRNYIEQNQILDAFKYVHNHEMSFNDAFATSSEWYNIVWLVLSKYEQLPNTKKDWEFWLLLAICLERQVYISFSLSTSGGVTETANLLFNLDQYLFKISQLADKLCAQRELVDLFLDHYRGQFLLHASSLIFKRELLQNKNQWKETVQSVLPLLLLAYQIRPVDNNKEPWMKHSDEQGKQLIQLWHREASFRCAQVGRTLLSCIADETGDKENSALQVSNMLGNQPTLWNSCDELLAQIRQTCSDKQWRRNIFWLLFCNGDQKVKDQSSLLIKSAKLAEPIFELPTYAEVELCEESAQFLRPQSLPHMVYLCLGNDNLAYVRARYFNGLNFSTQNLPFCGAESLNQLDVETFLYASSLQAKRMLAVDRDVFDSYYSGNSSAAGKPRILPFVNLQAHLCSEEQANWWTAAYQVYKNLTGDNLSELRANLQFGIEAVRGINGPKLDMIIVFKLGQIFVARAQDIVKPVEKAFLEARAESIYKCGLNMLKMHNRAVLEPFRKYFKYVKANSSAVEREVNSAAEDAVSYLAARYFKKADYDELIKELAGIQLPFATYLQAEAYRKLDEVNRTPRKSKGEYLDRASECLNQTLSLLKSTHTDPNHPLNSVIHAELKRLQHASNKFINDSFVHNSPHNNSSTYEDAEADFSDHSLVPAASVYNRSRREVAAAALLASSSPRNTELENLVKQMATTLTFVKEEIVDVIKPEFLSMRKEITSLKDKITNLEDAMKKTHITSNPPSRDDASNVLDDLYMIEDALQNQMYQQSPQTPHMPSTVNNMFPSVSNGGGGVPSPFVQQQQQRIHTPNAMQMQQNAAVAAAAAYNNPIFNPNYPMNYYTPPYMMTAQNAAGANAMLGQRNPLSLPYMDAGGMNFNMPPNAPLLTQPNADGRNSNLYGLLNQQQQQQNTPAQMPQLSVAMSMPALAHSITTNAAGPPLVAAAAVAVAPPSHAAPAAPIQFNKTLNNQPVEKGPPANVVITSSDPLPNPNSASLQSQQPTLSVTIPSHHIKPSLVQTPDANVSHAAAPVSTAAGGSVFGGFGLGGSASMNTPFAGFGSSTNTLGSSSVPSFFSATSKVSAAAPTLSTSSALTTSVSSTTFSFKPQVAEAAAKMSSAASIDASIEATINNANNESNSSDLNKSFADPEVEYDPRPDFKPIIPLPDEIEVKTGEEDEEIMFCYRAKLFRNVDKEWKERGIGDIKILKNKEGYSRILMRRDQTHKICANHKITKEIMLTTPQKETKGHIWVANDFADEKLKLEKFFVRFKLPETAQEFAEAFKKAQSEAESLNEQQSNPIMAAPKAATTAIKTEEKKTQKATTLPPFGLAKSGVANFATSTPTVKTLESGGGGLLAKPANFAQTSTITTKTSDSSTASKTLFTGFNLAPAVAKVEPAPKPAAGAAAVSPFANFTFDKSAPATTSTAAAPALSTTSSPFANIFSNLGKSTPSPFSTANLATTFQSPLIASTTPNSSTTPVASAADSTLNKSETEGDDYVPTAQFEPVIPLPDLVEVSTGEEHEIVLFEHRAKILRFDKEAGEWKERGLGIMKLLQDEHDANQVRLVMRREQILKLCCNQRLYKDTVFKNVKNSQTALTWAGQDYSENYLVTEMLTVRFKTAETCKQFHEAILKAQANMSSAAVEDNAKKQETKDNQKKAEEKESKAIETPKGFGDAFKPKAGSWTCDACYIHNPGENLYCVACDSPKDDTVPKKAPANPLLTTTSNTKFSFGFPAAAATGTSAASSTTAPAPIAKSIFGNSTAAVASTTTSSSTTIAKPAASSSQSSAGFGDSFKPKVGSWDCADCYLSNTADSVYCKACDAPKDSTIPKKEPATNNILALSNPSQKFSFGFAAAVATGVNTTATTTISSVTATQSEPTKSIFGSLANAANTEASKSFTFTPPSATSTTLTAALSKPTFSFSLPSKTMEAAAGNNGSAEFSLDKKDFSFTMKPKSPGKGGKSPLKFGGDADAADDGDDGDYHEEEENNTYFTPVIPLPDKIEVKTGEENEQLLYVHRAKLYRFTDGEWKERGLGDVKILRHTDTGKLRVVMRREQIWKICLNHVLNDEVDYKRKDDKSWLFVVNDFSEGTVELEQCTLRFKNKEIAQEFMDAITSALDGSAVAIEAGGATTHSTSLSTPTNDLPPTTVAAIGISEADRNTADKLQLPYEFFTAQPTCTGCRGCDSDNFVFGSVKSSEAFINPEDATNPLNPLEMPALSLPKGDGGGGNRSLLKQSVFSSSSGNAKLNDSIFSGFGGANSTAVTNPVAEKPANTTFSFAAALNSTTTPSDNSKLGGSGEFLFGSSANANTGGSLFGGDNKTLFGQTPSIFRNANTSNAGDKTTSIFGGNVSSSAGDKTTSIFGGNATSNTGGSIFDGKSSFGATPSIFDGIKSETSSNTTKSIFGTSSNTTQSGGGGNSLFGSSTAFSAFGNKSAAPNSIFSNTTTTANNNLFDSIKKEEPAAASFADLSNKAGAIDFASLAAKATVTPAKSTDSASPGSFFGLTNQDAFSSFNKPKGNNNNSLGTPTLGNESFKSADNSVNDENYDPHYEPIIALPNEIVVSTGEEEETKLFGERATLYRWDATNKEWKERGVGELKILVHPAKQTHRLVMRREQIHKLVLNHAVGADFIFNAMKNNPKSLVWATMNYAEATDGVLEKLAVRFKKVELAEQFTNTLNDCIEVAKKTSSEQTQD